MKKRGGEKNRTKWRKTRGNERAIKGINKKANN